ncbi:basic amino acid ABC transporter substrate-binding protein [Neisseria sp. Ec49-e6-T10]|uniref:basic amino acid ABC transporter substrate-binding protein n=1 Tax=Neisseria sp. Ec49-e6-T10 TaxID=3140744 RepID=UPI003EC12978
MLTQKKWLAPIILASLLALNACQKSETTQNANSGASEPTATNTTIEFKAATDAAYAPFEFQDTDGKLTGFSIEVLEAAGQKAGFNIKMVQKSWEGIFNSLDQGDIDIVAASVTITDERKQTMDFSDPYFEATQLIAIKDDNTSVHSFNDLKDKTVSVQNGTTGDIVIQKLQGKTSTNIKRFESMPLALKEVAAGGVEASIGDFGVMENFVKNNPDIHLKTMMDNTFEKEFYGFAVKKGRPDLVAKINEGLKIIHDDGTYDEIYKKYFGEKKATAPSAQAASAVLDTQ